MAMGKRFKKDLSGKRAIVTGAAAGMGLEYSRQLALRGCDVLMIDRNTLDDVAKDLRKQAGVEICTLQLDLSQADATERVVEWLAEHDYTPDILINNAGVFDFRQVSDLSDERVELYLNLHVRTLTHLCRKIGDLMKQRGAGYILNMSSMSCWMPMPGIALYSATKAYIHTFSRALYHELRDSGVSITVVCPGAVATNLYNLSESLQRLGVRIGVLYTPQRLVRNALRRMLRRRPQYINGLLNRISIVFVNTLPNWVVKYAKRRLLK